jgi:endonuclease/exonuclease/phosphatase family metal-dependent hydrolase
MTQKVVSILSYNTCLLPNWLSNTSDNERILNFFSTFGVKKDILLLSEVWEVLGSSNQSLFNVLALAKQYNFVNIYYTPRKWYELCNNGLLILSRYPIIKTSSVTFQSSSGFQWFVPNGGIYCQVEVQNKKINLFTTHIHAGTLDTSCCNSSSIVKRVQKNQVIELKEWIDSETISSEIPWIVSGDFNIDANDTPSGSMMLNYNILKTIMKSDSLLRNINFPCTYPVPGSFLLNKSFDGQNTCIDHVFSSSIDIRINVIDLKVKGVSLSDHFAVDIEFSYL